MQTILIGDPHSGLKSRPDPTPESTVMVDFFFDETFGFISHAIDSHPMIDTSILMGDTFEKREFTNNRILQKTIEFFKFKYAHKKFILIGGNHDMTYRTTNQYSMAKVLAWACPNITLVPEETLTIDNMLFVNWINPENKDLIMGKINDSNAQYLFGHFDIIGAMMLPGTLSTRGITPAELTKFDHVFSGHYHIGSTLKNITYVGTPIQMNFSDVDDRKSVIIFDSTTGEWSRFYNDKNLFVKQNLHISDINSDTQTDIYNDKIVQLTINLDSRDDVKNADLKKFAMSVASVAKQASIRYIPKSEVEHVELSVDVESNDSNQVVETVVAQIEDPSVKEYFQHLYTTAKNNVTVGDE